ncbi:MAG: glycosyltransferase family 4 protein, partial [Planctomycetes bacterium]|nr:glycosyltransferase family 4 protein [Planctomycetota bacterium]
LRVALLSAYPPSHYGTVSRLTRWLPHLARRGIDAAVLCPSTDGEYAAYGRGDPAADARYLGAALRARASFLAGARSWHAVVLHRAVLPFGPWQRPTFERILSRIQPRWVFDFYDSLWVLRRTAAAGSRSAPARFLNPPDAVETACRLARAVTVSGEFLASFARPHGRDVRILPMLLDPGEYAPRPARDADPVVLGWMGNRWNLPRLHSIGPALRALAARRRILLRVVAPERVEIPGVPVESLVHPWSEESERRDLASIDVGLLPLFDDEEDRGKFPFKSIQYAAAGLPVVSSPVAMDPSAFREGESVLYARTGAEWEAAMERLVVDRGLRERLGAGARRTLEERYSFGAHAEGFAGLLRETAAGPAHSVRPPR